MAKQVNLKKLTRHEMCSLLATYDSGATSGDAFTTAYINNEVWLAGYTFVKQLAPNEVLYMVCLHDDEGPNPYEGVCACFVHVTIFTGDKMQMRWAEWPPAM